tara:strand:+ start:10082 stop:11167 length:1086 start_codon:yes stop_codon:yes gene_type:complete
MNILDHFHSINPYSLNYSEKKKYLTKALTDLTKHHKNNCEHYSKYLDILGCDISKINDNYDIPFIPVRSFKEHELKSIDDKDVFKTMTSSGTTGQIVSKIFIDKKTALLQQKVLIKLLNDFIGKSRLPMLIVDSPLILKKRDMFSSRGAVILSFNFISRGMSFALNDDMSINFKEIEKFVEKNKNSKFIIFGFTFMIWKHFYQELKKKNLKLDLPNSFMIQSGGWKKLESESVSRKIFKNSLTEQCGITNFLDMYGMVEQTGCNYMECEYGNLHSSIYSDIIIRNPYDFKVCDVGEPGIIQIQSTLAHSYPGHSLITEDEGIITGIDNCKCGRLGKTIKILGRIKSAELRGCSDTYAEGVK